MTRLAAELPLFPVSHDRPGVSVGSILVKLKCSDLEPHMKEEISLLRRAVQNAGLEHRRSSTTYEHLDILGRLSSGSDLLKSLGVLTSKFDLIAKVIDEVSKVSR